MSTPRRVRARAPAKVNLALAILGRRPDGYHEIDTWMLALDLEDELVLERDTSGAVHLQLDGPCVSSDIPADARNLAVRAASEVLRLARERGRAGARDGIALRLSKNVPSQAGLGAASADAAAAWLAAQKVLDFELETELGERALAALGSDCMFFFSGAMTGFAHCLGRGEQVKPAAFDGARRWIAILSPSVRAPTAQVYAAFTTPLLPVHRPPSLPRAWFENPVGVSRAALSNDLERAALLAIPELRPWRACLDSCEAAHFRLSGSGSSFFSLYSDATEARADLDRIEAALREAGLVTRGTWLVRPSGRGARILPDV